MLKTRIPQRRRWMIRGQVQGVGFRPYVYRLAQEAHLTGLIRNNCDGVIIEAQGLESHLADFVKKVQANLPPSAHIRDVAETTMEPVSSEHAFYIGASDDRGIPAAAITPDIALCAECRQELLDVSNRRYEYGLITCTNCGPRYSIIQNIPYDRPATTMAEFKMCPACNREYDAPADRRFHAQPIACHACGPQVSLVDSHGETIPGEPITQAAGMLRDGRILAIKGIGGFHLAARADDARVVRRLRQVKQRDTKPFALMCRSVSDARRFIKLSAEAQAAMAAPEAPIVLAMRQSDAPVAAEVADGNCRLGVMLPYTPIHHLLFAQLDKAVLALIMTSGNVTDEPLAISNIEAMERLGELCDGLLWHDRPIARCVDDSVVLDMGTAQRPVPIRRSRGFVPAAITLGMAPRGAGLCLGGELKNTVAVVRDSQVILSQHLGDLNNNLARQHFMETIEDLCRLYKITPEFIAHDTHPLYISAQYAVQLAKRWNAQLIAVQHHHAHAAAVLAEHAVNKPVLALICDGTGLGLDGTGWGCELLRVQGGEFQRLASLNPMLLPGGDMAAQDIRRSALAILHQTFGPKCDQLAVAQRLIPDSAERQMLALMLARRIQCVTSSSAGRVFDGVAALLGICAFNHFEAEAPMALEAAALSGAAAAPEKLWNIFRDDHEVERVDLRPLFRYLVEQVEKGAPAAVLAALFHAQFAAAWEEIIVRTAIKEKLNTVALSGGVFANQLLLHDLNRRLDRRGMTVLRHEKVPPNDGGLALGQALVAAARWNASALPAQKAEMECAPCA
ncbi:MAG: carbamoyltransferase HypF [Phycisphaerae bacterium]